MNVPSKADRSHCSLVYGTRPEHVALFCQRTTWLRTKATCMHRKWGEVWRCSWDTWPDRLECINTLTFSKGEGSNTVSEWYLMRCGVDGARQMHSVMWANCLVPVMTTPDRPVSVCRCAIIILGRRRQLANVACVITCVCELWASVCLSAL